MPPATLRLLRVTLVVALLVAAVAVLRLTLVVSVPVVLALFVLMLALPLQRALQRRGLRRGLADLLTLLAVAGVVLVFVGLLYLLAQAVVAQAPDYGPQLDRLLARWRQHLTEWPGAEGGNGEGIELQSVIDYLLGLFPAVFSGLYGLLGLAVLTASFLVLGLIESHGLAAKVRAALRPATATLLLEATQEWSYKLQRYMLGRTAISAATGLAVGGFTWAIGLDMPEVWGISTFLLNFIPILGSIIAVVPPVLVAFLQPQAWMGFVTLGGLTTIQLLMGNYVDPRLEGRILSLSPFVLFLSVVFWGWVWGVPGALMGIPITAGILIFCRRAESTRWIAQLLEHHADKPQAAKAKHGRLLDL